MTRPPTDDEEEAIRRFLARDPKHSMVQCLDGSPDAQAIMTEAIDELATVLRAVCRQIVEGP